MTKFNRFKLKAFDIYCNQKLVNFSLIIIFFLTTILTLYLQNGYSIFSSNFLDSKERLFMSNAEFYILFIIDLFLYCFGYILVLKNYKISFPFWILILISTLFLAEIIRTCVSVSTTSYSFYSTENVLVTFDYSITADVAIQNLFSELIFMFFILEVAYVFPKLPFFKKLFISVLFIGLVFVLIACLYSYIAEFETYKLILKDPSGRISVLSFFTHKNMFGLFLLVGVICALLLNYFKHCFIYHFFILLFDFTVLFTFSKSTMIVLYRLSFFNLIYVWVYSYKLSKRYFIQYSIFASFIVISVVILGIIAISNEKCFLGVIYNHILDSIKNEHNTVDLRYILWGNLNQMMNSFYRVVFGYSYRVGYDVFYNFNKIVNPRDQVVTVHNGFYEILLDYGLIGFVLICFVYALIVYKIFKLFTYKKYAISTMLLAIEIALIMNTYVESRIVFYRDYCSLPFTFLAYVIVEYFYVTAYKECDVQLVLNKF